MSMSRLPQSGSSHLLTDLTWPDAARVLSREAIVLLPVGAIEAHGPHLPLDTDVAIALATARQAAATLAERGDCVVIAPPVHYGVSYVGTCFPGTIPAPPEVVTGLIASVLTTLAGLGPRRLAVVNAHLEPAHVAAVGAGVAQAIAESGARIAFPDKRQPRWAAELSDEFRQGARHAGSYETSLMLAIRPTAVRRDLLPDLPPVWVDLPAQLAAGARTFAEAGGRGGFFGNPAGATAAEGERLLAALTTMVVTAIDEL